jgi:O-antigen/teichoic acid export membrane protein
VIFSILTVGCMAGSGYMQLQMIFNQTGRPRNQNEFMIGVFSINVVTNIMCIWIAGPIGAAVATGSGFVVQAFIIKTMIRRLYGLHI